MLLTKAFGMTPIFAQAAGGLAQGASKAMGIVMLIGFIFGTICVVGGGFAIRRGDTDAGKLSIIGGLIIAGAPCCFGKRAAGWKSWMFLRLRPGKFSPFRWWGRSADNSRAATGEGSAALGRRAFAVS